MNQSFVFFVSSVPVDKLKSIILVRVIKPVSQRSKKIYNYSMKKLLNIVVKPVSKESRIKYNDTAKQLLNKVVKPFLPTYEVTCINYQIIPGQPVNKNQLKHTFEKGASEEAKAFYQRVVTADITKNMAPVEVHLKRRGRVIEKMHYGPVEELKKYKMVSVN